MSGRNATRKAPEHPVVAMLAEAGIVWRNLSDDAKAHAVMAWHQGEALDQVTQSVAELNRNADLRANRQEYVTKKLVAKLTDTISERVHAGAPSSWVSAFYAVRGWLRLRWRTLVAVVTGRAPEASA